MKEFTITGNDSNQRVDKFLSKAVPRLPENLMYKSIRIKRIKLNGKRCEIKTRLNVGDVLSLYLNDEFFINDPKTKFLSAPPRLNILFEDENILLANKPAGLVVHEDNDNSHDTLINRIVHYLFKKGEYDPEVEISFVPALCNRIDRNTCGIVISAKNAESLRIINEKIKAREVEKIYLCAVHGIPKPSTATITHYLKKDESKNMVTVSDTPDENSKTAITNYTVLKSRNSLSLVQIGLETGRTHQIRAQMAHIGHPLLGDGKYGLNERRRGYRHQALSSHSLTFKFTSDAGILNYLNGMNFKTDGAWFCKLFD